MTTFRVGSASDVGQVRSNNQDSKLVADHVSVFAVADGMGGHQGGEVASAIAVETLEAVITEPTTESVVEAVREANRRIFSRAADSAELRGMGTTLVGIALVNQGADDEEVAWVNVGDSRAYLLRDGELHQLSRDHSLVEDLKRGGQLTEEEAAVHPQRNILTRALGIDVEVDVDWGAVEPWLGDRFLLCSDGLFNEVDKATLIATLEGIEDPQEASARLVELANAGGGRDNITCVVADVTEDGGRAERAAAAAAVAAANRAAAGEQAEGSDAASPAGDATIVAEAPTVEMPAVDPDAPPPDIAALDDTPTTETPGPPPPPATGPGVPTPVVPGPPPPVVDGADPAPPPDEPVTEAEAPAEVVEPTDDGAPPAEPTDAADTPDADPVAEAEADGAAPVAAAGVAAAAAPGKVPTDGVFPTPKDPGFPSDDPDDGEPDEEASFDDLPFGRKSDDLYDDINRAKKSHWVLVVLGSIVFLAALAGALYVGGQWYANRTYFLADDDGQVVVMRGQPGGFVIFDPTVEERLEVKVDALDEEGRAAITRERTFDTAADAATFARSEVVVEDEPATTTEPTTTVTPSTTASEPEGPTSSTTTTPTTTSTTAPATSGG